MVTVAKILTDLESQGEQELAEAEKGFRPHCTRRWLWEHCAAFTKRARRRRRC
jgi:hypothetical protein